MKMAGATLWIAALLFITVSDVSKAAIELGGVCDSDLDCPTKGSTCISGTCACLPFHTRSPNGTACLQSTLLGYDCLMDEQCSMRVARSRCVRGVCRCEDGFLQFRKHTCLGPARPGDVCYSNAHCRLWETGTRCEFLIPNLFGRCQCMQPLRPIGDRCIRPTKPTPATPPPLITNRVEDLVIPPVPTVSQVVLRRSDIDIEKRIRGRLEEGDGTVTLGLPCLTNEQCQAADLFSRCSGGVCDCIWQSTVGSCSANRTGCSPGTFQCKATGVCISWYFVCDGRPDCPDGSDEKCSGVDGECPEQAYRCPISGKCVSKAARCDGDPDCGPMAEDEHDCYAGGRRGCPEHTFQCNDGRCLPEHEFCNAVVSCADGSDEPPHLCKGRSRRRAATASASAECPLRCANGRCRSTAIACSGRDGCGDGSDEVACAVCRCPRPPASVLNTL